MVHPSGSIVLLVVVHTGRRNNGWNNGWNKNRTPHELLLSRGQLNYNKATCAVDTSQIVVRTVRTISTVQWWCRIVHSCWWSKSETNYRILVPTAYPRCELCSSVPRDESDQHTVRCARLGSAVSPLPTGTGTTTLWMFFRVLWAGGPVEIGAQIIWKPKSAKMASV